MRIPGKGGLLNGGADNINGEKKALRHPQKQEWLPEKFQDSRKLQSVKSDAKKHKEYLKPFSSFPTLKLKNIKIFFRILTAGIL